MVTEKERMAKYARNIKGQYINVTRRDARERAKLRKYADVARGRR